MERRERKGKEMKIQERSGIKNKRKGDKMKEIREKGRKTKI